MNRILDNNDPLTSISYGVKYINYYVRMKITKIVKNLSMKAVIQKLSNKTRCNVHEKWIAHLNLKVWYVTDIPSETFFTPI